MTWSEALALGHPDVDAQHRAIIEHMHTIVSEIVDASTAEISAKAPDLVKFLGQHFAMHFVAEEGLMEEARYPDLVHHREEHRRFFVVYEQARKRVEEEKSAEATLILITIATDWVGTHVFGSDARFVDFTHSRGAA